MELKDKSCKLIKGTLKGRTIEIKDLWTNINDGKSWRDSIGVPIALEYAFRAGRDKLPIDDNVYIGKIGFLELLVHESELDLIDDTKKPSGRGELADNILKEMIETERENYKSNGLSFGKREEELIERAFNTGGLVFGMELLLRGIKLD